MGRRERDSGPSVYLTVQPMPGSVSTSVCEDICSLAKQLDIFVSVEMNGVEAVAGPSATPESVHSDFLKRIERAVIIARGG